MSVSLNLSRDLKLPSKVERLFDDLIDRSVERLTKSLYEQMPRRAPLVLLELAMASHSASSEQTL